MQASTILIGADRAPARSQATWFARSWYLLVPCIFVAILAGPIVRFQLPNFESTITEEYQPVKALKFFSTRGTAFHKWGPVDNFLLAPSYAVSMGYWWLTGALDPPSTQFPYGFKAPLQQ